MVIRHKTESTAVPDGLWRLRIKNATGARGSLHIWALDDQNQPQVFFTGTSVADSHKIGSPGTAKEAVTVASYTTRIEWTDINGDERETDLALNKISDFSSEGPLRDGARKPDVAAPGAMIVSCLSSDAEVDEEYRLDDKYFVEAGTSMASPFICGVVALLLERIRHWTRGKEAFQGQ